MEQGKVKYWYDRVYFVPKFVWIAIVFGIIVYACKGYFAPSWSAPLTIGPSGVTIKTEVADTVNNVESSIASATSTVNAVGNEFFPVIENLMIVYKVDPSYFKKLGKGKSDMQGIARLLEEAQESLKTLNLDSEMKVADTVNNVVSSIESATSTVNTVGNELFPVIGNITTMYNVDPLYLKKLEKGKSDMQGILRLLDEAQESLKTLNLGSELVK